MAQYPTTRLPPSRLSLESRFGFHRDPVDDTRRWPIRFPQMGLGVLWAVLIGLTGCQGAPPAGITPDQFRQRPTSPAESPTSQSTSQTPRQTTSPRPAAIVNGTSISWQTINTSVRELAGDIALTDAVLDVLLQIEFDRLGLKLDSAYAADERNMLIASIRKGADVTEEQADELLGNLRRDRGLGPQRFAELLRRNAMLRQLAQVRIIDTGGQITEDDVRRRFEIVYGPKVLARIITVPAQREAISVRAQLLPQDDSLSDRFARAAVAHSTDGTSARGGLLEPISPADPAYEASIRRVLELMEVGELSNIVAFENGFAILLVEEKTPATSETIDDVADALRLELESRQVRLVMERFARELLDRADVTVFDPSLEWAWKGMRH